jgi:hypothetical protein
MPIFWIDLSRPGTRRSLALLGKKAVLGEKALAGIAVASMKMNKQVVLTPARLFWRATWVNGSWIVTLFGLTDMTR